MMKTNSNTIYKINMTEIYYRAKIIINSSNNINLSNSKGSSCKTNRLNSINSLVKAIKINIIPFLHIN